MIHIQNIEEFRIESGPKTTCTDTAADALRAKYGSRFDIMSAKGCIVLTHKKKEYRIIFRVPVAASRANRLPSAVLAYAQVVTGSLWTDLEHTMLDWPYNHSLHSICNSYMPELIKQSESTLSAIDRLSRLGYLIENIGNYSEL